VVWISSDGSMRLAAAWHVALSRVQDRVQELSIATFLLGAACAMPYTLRLAAAGRLHAWRS
jgi:hypothetical protein